MTIRLAGIATVSLLLIGCNQAAEPTQSNNASGTVSAREAEKDLMSEGYSGERSSGPSGVGDSNLGTTGPTNASGSAAGPGGTGSARENNPGKAPPND
jgi:hypothetical protein